MSSPSTGNPGFVEDTSPVSLQPDPLPETTVPDDPTHDETIAPPVDPGTPTFPSNLYSDLQQGPAPFFQYRLDVKYEVFTGIIQVPVAAPAPRCSEIIRVHQPYGTKVVKWTCERVGAQPICPHWDTGNANEVLTYRYVQPTYAALSPDGGVQVWRVSGLYVYALCCPLGDDSGFFIGTLPTDIAGVEIIGAQQFSRTILASMMS